MNNPKPSGSRDLYQEATDRIIKALESGLTPWQKPWENVNTGPLRNASSNRAYRGCVNSILLHAASMERGFSDPRWISFKQCQENGWKVKKGAKSEKIYFSKPLMVDERELATGKILIDAETGKPRQKQIPFLQVSPVFNAQEIDGIPPLVPSEVTFSPIAAGEEILKRSPVEIRTGGNRAFYNPASDSIAIPDMAQFISQESFYSTAAHEIIHSTGHKDRCNREFGKRFGDNAYAYEEMIAEMGSLQLAMETGLPSQIENHASYVEHWLSVLKSDKKAIFSASAQATKAVNFIMGRQQPEANADQSASIETQVEKKAAAKPTSIPSTPIDDESHAATTVIPSTMAVVAKLKARRANQSATATPKSGPALGAR